MSEVRGNVAVRGNSQTARESKRVLLLTAPRPRPNYTPLHYGDNRAPQGLGYVAKTTPSYPGELGSVNRFG